MNFNKAFYPLLISIILAGGIFIGYKIQDRNASRLSVFSEGNSKLENILQLIEARYVDTVDTEHLYDDAIAKMLEDLDPHSVYLPPVEMSREAEMMDGNFEGIGIEFMIINDTISVVTPISGGPSEQAGISAGDKIIFIDDSLVAGNKVTNELVMKKLKGPKNTKVKVTMLKNSTKKLVAYTIKRDKIPIYSVDAGFMLDNEVGYIKVNRFAKNTYQEFMEKLDGMQQKNGMKKLILDLRQNPGGYLDQAALMADEFLAGSKNIVYTEGRTMPRTYEKASNMGLFEEGKLIILIDEGSASASEIVSGAMQDWDRGILIGRRTFGKGLVQQEYPLGDGSSVRLTVAKYFTPSGRCIQRPYEANINDYYGDINKRFKDGESFSADSIKQNSKKVYKTLVKGRTVYADGGITPDIFIPMDTSMFNPFVNEVFGYSLIQEFVYDYFAANKARFSNYKSAVDFRNNFILDDNLYAQFTAYCFAHGVKKESMAYTAKSRAYLGGKLKAYFAKQLWKTDGYFLVNAQEDKMIQRAMQEMKKP
jgi:carboxyl-terminal processing protease